MSFGKTRGIADHGDPLAKMRVDGAVDKLIDDVLGKGIGYLQSPQAAKAHSDTIGWYAERLSLSRQDLIQAAERLREQRDRMRFGKSASPQELSEVGQVEGIRRAQTQRPFMPHWVGG
jgi:hypothetical protein